MHVVSCVEEILWWNDTIREIFRSRWDVGLSTGSVINRMPSHSLALISAQPYSITFWQRRIEIIQYRSRSPHKQQTRILISGIAGMYFRLFGFGQLGWWFCASRQVARWGFGGARVESEMMLHCDLQIIVWYTLEKILSRWSISSWWVAQCGHGGDDDIGLSWRRTHFHGIEKVRLLPQNVLVHRLVENALSVMIGHDPRMAF